jgi:WD40 repeat protein
LSLEESFQPVHLSLSRDEKLLAVTGECNAVRLVDLKAGKEVLAGGHRVGVSFLAFSPDGKSLVSQDLAGGLRHWDAEGNPLKPPLRIPEGSRCVAQSPDGRVLASTAGDGVIRLSEPGTGKELSRIKIEEDVSLAFSPDGRLVVLRGSQTQSLRLFEVATGQWKHTLIEGKQLVKPVGGVAEASASPLPPLLFSPGGRFLATAHAEQVRVYDTETGKEFRQFPSPEDSRLILGAFSHDGRVLALSGKDGHVKAYELSTGKERLELRHDLLGMLTDGGVSGVRVDGKVRFTNEAGSQPLAFSPDGTLLAQIVAEHRVRLWDLRAGKVLVHLSGHRGAIETVTFSPDGKRLATGSADTTVLLWEVPRLPAPKPEELTAEQLEALGKDLSGADAVRAYQAINRLAGTPRQTLPWLKEHLKAARPMEKGQVDQWIADLDSPRFAARDKAQRELARTGSAALPALRRALEKTSSLEARKRLQELIDQAAAQMLSDDNLLILRGVELLERIRTDESRRVLRSLAEGAPWTLPALEATGAIHRLPP